MKLETAIGLLRMLPTQKEMAKSVADLMSAWPEDRKAANLSKQLHRNLNELSARIGNGPALVQVIEERPQRYYLDLAKVVQWFMTPESAMQILLAHPLLDSYLGDLDILRAEEQAAIAWALVEGSSKSGQLKRMMDVIRILPDGIGRVPAKINKQTKSKVLEAIVKQCKLTISYISSKLEKHNIKGSPLALVAKDGTLYLLMLGELGAEQRIFHLPLQRFEAVELHIQEKIVVPKDFDLDRYIDESHKLSHVLYGNEEPIQLELRVGPDVLFHFKERPLVESQTIVESSSDPGWYTVRAKIPNTVLLVPFLLSLGSGIEVLGPPAVREEIMKRLNMAYQRYL